MIMNEPSVRMSPPPRMSPMSESGSGKLVSTGIRIGTVSMQVKATNGATQYSQEAVSGTTICLWKSFQRSR